MDCQCPAPVSNGAMPLDIRSSRESESIYAPLNDRTAFEAVLKHIHQEARGDREYRFMEFCGGHTHALFHFGIPELLPSNVRMIHGPGCPVCVMPMSRIDLALRLAEEPGVTLASYGDLLRVPGSNRRSLLHAKADGHDVRMVYSCLDALELARSLPHRQIIFFAIGFETTTPPTAVLIQRAAREGVKNLSVVCNHVLTPAAMEAILTIPGDGAPPVTLQGFIGPGHVSTVIGWKPYERFATEYKKPVVISGFEPVDLVVAILRLIEQTNDGRSEVQNEMKRLVQPDGNPSAIQAMADVFELRDSFEWRGLGSIPRSALKIRSDYSSYDAELRFSVELPPSHENPACQCGAILRGALTPPECKLFGKGCTPDNPVGSCMVSSEGACAAYYRYRAAPERDARLV